MAVILFIILGSFCGLGYYLNKKTPRPEGCEEISEKCEGCNITSCVNHPSKGDKNELY